ncbi:hypothetical protein MNBD_CHLOROFLEXI01-2021 [hydrothermal vent metagenome]|uniref:Uncharacterized protein n=1 Tax=hydrothermal vent metagenome TaxID=652676 RepID=A0A3B0VIT8_9ZZZZ
MKRKNCRYALLRDEANKAVRELAQVPLLLALLCLVFEERNDFPPGRHEIYEEATRALLSKWDASRNISRDVVYQQLSLGRKQKMLATIAAKTFEKGDYFLKEREVVRLLGDYLQGVPRLDEPDAERVLQTLEAQHGIFVERARRIHSFSHLTLQEYFTARYTVDNESRGAVARLMAHVGDDRWREVFLLVAGMLEDATEFGEQYIDAAHDLLNGDVQLIERLNWAAQKAAVVQIGYKPSASRALLHSLDIASDLGLDLALNVFLPRDIDDFDFETVDYESLGINVEPLDSEQELPDSPPTPDLDFTPIPVHAYALALDLDSDLASARDLARDHARTRVYFLDNTPTLLPEIARVIDLSLARIFSCDLALRIAEQQNLAEMTNALKKLTPPDKEANREVRSAFAKKLSAILDQYEDRWNPFHLLTITKKDAFSWKELPKEKIEYWSNYFQANLLLVKCLQVAYVPNRQALEDKILLPPESL